MRNDVSSPETADVVVEVVVVILGKRRHVEAPDSIVTQDLQGLLLQLWRVINDEFIRDPVPDDGVYRFGANGIENSFVDKKSSPMYGDVMAML